MELTKTKYKQTEVGQIPEDWSVVKLSQAVDFIDGMRKPVKSNERIAGDIPYYGASGIIDWVRDYIFDDDLILLGEDGENILSRNLPLAFIVSGKSWINNHAHVMKPKGDYDIYFLAEYLESLDYTLLNSGTAQPKLNKQSCLNIDIVKPTLLEQKSIATALRDVDLLINSLNKLVTKKKAIKQGAMQELLTPPHKGGKRLAGFIEDWKELDFGSVFSFFSTSNFSKAQMQNEGEIGCIHYGLIHAISNSHYDLDKGIKYYVQSEKARYEIIKDGDVIMVDASEDLDGLNKSVEVFGVGRRQFIAGLHTYLLRDRNSLFEDKFRGLILNSTYVKAQMLKLAVGMKVYGVSKTQLINIKIPIPPKAEQKTIAKILSDMDTEIEAMLKKKTKYQHIKQGMMQELLTGKTRLV
jgi:type I restriction enzyme S subunit